MVKINLLKEREPAVFPDIEPSTEPVPQSPVETVEPSSVPETKSRSILKILLLILIPIIGGTSAYILWSRGWSLSSEPAETTQPAPIVADEATFDDTPAPPVEEPPAEEPPPVIATQPVEQPPPRETEVIEPPKGTEVVATTPSSGQSLIAVREGRLKLDVFADIVSSVDESVIKAHVVVADDRVTLELGMNSRATAAKFLSAVRNKWKGSNLEAVVFEKASPYADYRYNSQFEGAVDLAPASSRTDATPFVPFSLRDFESEVSTRLVRSGIKLKAFQPLHENRGIKGVLPILITAEGNPGGIINFIEAFSGWNAAFGISKAVMRYEKGSNTELFLYVNLIKVGSSASS